MRRSTLGAVFVLLGWFACGTEVVVERDEANTTGTTSAGITSSDASGSVGGGSSTSSGLAGAAGSGGDANPGCPADTLSGQPCTTEGLFCPSSESCSGYLQCLNGAWTLVNPC